MHVRRLLTVGVLAASLLGLTAPRANAAPATVGRFFNQDTEVNPVDGTECVSSVGPGTETATFTNSGRFVQTNSGFHVEGIGTIDSHTVFTNGYHITANGQTHFTFNTNFTSGQTVNTAGGGNEIHTIFNAENVVIAQVKFVGVFHITYRDLNGNGQPDDGEITSSFERFHFICF